ncbi:MAG: LEPR-XLL domain-containing protein, partial [Betaproteobacteria bacterium]|nr:LEPR-XLL domain-containing protein [Betaproteobacteria bacterium]
MNTTSGHEAMPEVPIPTLSEIFFGKVGNWCRKMRNWRKHGLLKKGLEGKRRRAMRMEALEPRLLLSADLSYTAAASGDLTLRVADIEGSQTLQLIDSQDSATVVAWESLSNIDGSSGYGARIEAGAFDVNLRIDASVEAAGVTGGVIFVGGEGANSLLGADLANIWQLTASGSGTVGSVTFSGVENLAGGSDADTLMGWAPDSVWNITGADAGDVEGISFEDIENLLGAADNEDTFIVGALGSLSGVMDGGAGGFDSLVLDGGAFTTVEYVATGPNSGSVTRDGVVLRYDGLEPIVNTGTAADVVFTTSGVDDRATLTDNNNGTLTLAPVSPFFTFESVTFNDPTNSLTINLGGDLGVPFLSKDVLTINSFVVADVDLIVNGDDGKDEVVISGTVNARDVTINAEKITVSSSITAASVTLTAAADDDGAVDAAGDYLGGAFMGLYIATPEAVIDLTGATLTVSGAVMLAATANTAFDATPSTLGGTGDASLFTILPTASIKLDGTTLTVASLSASALVTVDAGFTDAATAGDNDTQSDAAVTITVLVSTAETVVQGASAVNVSGAVSLTAGSNLQVDSFANGAAGNAGATLAVTEVNATTRTYVSGSSSIGANAGNLPDSVVLSAILVSDIDTQSTSTAGGADASGGGTNKSEQRLKDPNDDGNMADRAKTSTGDLNFAGAVVVSDYRPTTEVYIDTSGSVATAGNVTLSASATETVLARASGVNTGSAATGVGVAVAIGIIDTEVLAWLGGTTSYAAGTVALTATLDADATYTVEAIAGAGDSAQTNIAGALAISVVDTQVSALVASGANINLNGANLTLSATSATTSNTTAKPKTDPSPAELGIGASVAILVAENTTAAGLADSAGVTGADDVTITATGAHEDTTLAEAGAAGSGGGVAVGGAVAIAVVDNLTTADIDTGAATTVVGDVTASAIHHGGSVITADGTVLGGSTAIGAALALGFVENRAASTTRRSVSGGSVSFSAAGDGASTVTAKASAAGEASSGGGSADGQKTQQTDYANTKSGKSKGTTQSASSDGGSVSVAAALAVNVSSSEANASVSGLLTITGDLTLAASNNMDAKAIADGSAKDAGTGVGVAVAINVADMDNLAVLGTGVIVNGGFVASATMKDVASDVNPDEHAFEAKATSGASATDVGVAGSFALTYVDADTRAALEGTVNAGSDAVSLTAASRSTSDVEAKAKATGSTGVGASIAFNLTDQLTEAVVANGATLIDGSSLTLSATGTHDNTTVAKGGAAAAGSGTSVGGAVAISVVDNETEASVGTGAALSLSGNLSAIATHHGAT